MGLPIFATLVGVTVRELVRSKLLYNLLVFAVLFIGASLFVAQLTIGDWEYIIIDMGLVATELVGVLVAVLIGVSVLAGEIERKTIFPVLARPIGRGTFLLGRYTGLVAILAVNTALMTLVLHAVLSLAAYPPKATTLTAAGLIFVELALIAAVALFFSSFTTPVLASAFSLSFYLIGHLLADVRAYGHRSESSAAKTVTEAVYRILPDLELFNLKSQSANRLPVPDGFVAPSVLYGVLYTAAVLALAILVFRKRDLK